MPIVSFGIEFGSKLSDATATINLVADGHITFNAKAQVGSSTSFCYGIDAGADLYATIQAPKFPGWTLPQSKFQLASTPAIQIVPFTCPITSRDVKIDSYFANGTIPIIDPSYSSLSPHSTLEKRAKVYGPLFHLPKVSCPNHGGLAGDPGDCLFCDHSDGTEPIQKRAGETCDIQEQRSDESTCSDGTFLKRDLSALLDKFAPNGSSTDQDGQHLNHLEKRTQKFGSWDFGGLPNPVSFGDYPSCDKAAGASVSRWWGFEALDTKSNTCPTTLSKFDKNEKAGPYQTDHVFETQIVLKFLDMLRGNMQFTRNVRLPPGYTAASDDWVTGKLIVSRTLRCISEFPTNSSTKLGVSPTERHF
jgi:chitinase